MFKKMFLPALLLLCSYTNAQNTGTQDKSLLAMQRMMLKLITAAPGNFSAVKGTQEYQRGTAVFYTANLTATITDAKEMKEALATDFFGAMLTADDHIVVSPEGTIFLARYTDDAEFSITGLVTKAFTGMPAYIGDVNVKTEKIAGATADENMYILTYNNTAIGKLDCNTKLGTALLIIGIKK
jgi:hypothetical protein